MARAPIEFHSLCTNCSEIKNQQVTEYCTECGTQLIILCPKCGQYIIERNKAPKNCKYCGVKLSSNKA